MNHEYTVSSLDGEKGWSLSVGNLSIINLAIGFLVFSFLIQVFSPLRLDTDSMYYLSVAASHADGRGLFFYSVPTVFPPGYSLIVSLLTQLGIASSGTMIFVNFLFLILGLSAARELLKTHFELSDLARQLILMVTLSSFALVKYFPMPRSEIAFFGVLLSTLWLLTRIRRTDGSFDVAAVFGALIMSGIAISIRSIGIALLPALVLALAPPGFLSVSALLKNKSRLAILFTIAVAGLVIGLWVIKQTHYYETFIEQYAGVGWFDKLVQVFRFKMHEFGQIATNVPQSRLPEWGKTFFEATGLAVFAILIRGLWSRKRRFTPIDVFLITYAVILFVWPGDNPRFWIPVLPFLFGIAFESVAPLRTRRFFRLAVLTYGGAMLITGLLAHAYSTRLTFSADQFARLYGDGSLTPTYESALHGDTLSADVNMHVFRILLKYEDRVSETWNVSEFQPY